MMPLPFLPWALGKSEACLVLVTKVHLWDWRRMVLILEEFTVDDMSVLLACVYIYHMHAEPTKHRRGNEVPWNWSYRWL